MRIDHLKYFLFLFIITGCDIDQKEFQPESEFVKIYNHPNENISFYPVDVKELDNGGYLILTGIKNDTSDTEFPRAAVIRADERGEFMWMSESSWYSPVKSFLNLENKISFIAMNNQFESFIVFIDPGSGTFTGQSPLEVSMPLSGFQGFNEDIIVLGYDNLNRSSVVVRYSKSLILQNKSLLNVNADLQNSIQKHMNKTGKQYPFFITRWNNNDQSGYMVNCFYNFTLRTVIFDQIVNTPKGDIYSFQTEAAISSILHKDSLNFALTRYYDGNNYLMNDINVNLDESQNFNNVSGEILYELTESANVIPLKATFGNKKFTLFASQTNSNEIIIFQYPIDNEEKRKIHKIDFSNTVEITEIQQSNDNGIIILAKTYVTGRFQRPLLIRMPESEFE